MSRFKHWSKSLVQPIGRHVWPLSAPNQCILLLRTLFMDILHLKEFGEAERVDTNAVCVFI